MNDGMKKKTALFIKYTCICRAEVSTKQKSKKISFSFARFIFIVFDSRINFYYTFTRLHFIFRPHRSTTYVDAAYCYSRVAWSVCLSETVVSPAKTAESIEMQFGLRTRVGPRNCVLDGGFRYPMEGAIF